MLDNRSIFLTSTPGWIGLKFDIFELMFYEILVMNMHNSQLVYNFLWARNKTFFLKFYMFYEIFGFITFISKQWEKVNWRPLQFRKQFLPRFFSYLQKNFNLFRSYMLDFILLTPKVCRFWSNSWIQQIRYVWLIVKKVWKSSETRQTVVRSTKNMRIDILPLLPARKIPRSSEI